MSEKDYRSALINKSHLDIEKIKNDAFAAGAKSKETKINEEFQRGLKQGKADDAERIQRETERKDEQRLAIFLDARTTTADALTWFQLWRMVHNIFGRPLR